MERNPTSNLASPRPVGETGAFVCLSLIRVVGRHRRDKLLQIATDMVWERKAKLDLTLDFIDEFNDLKESVLVEQFNEAYHLI